ncbi:MAG: choice-of-anchor Q domain-containing protein [Candidatus Brachytrichaceae bacterium NZ_4S206]|jgi:CSLREA domain-containing protein
MKLARLIVTLLMAGLYVTWYAAQPAHAATITVNTTDDELNTDGDCALREAIQAVNTQAAVDACPAGTGNDTINLPAGTYTLSLAGPNENNNATGDLDVFPISSTGGTVTLQGAGAGTTIIDGGGIDRVLHLIRSDSTLIVRDVTIRNGQLTDASGAGILSWGALELRNVIIENNIASKVSGDPVGGGFCIGCGPGTGSGVLEQVIIRNNQANRGGGIFSNRPLTITATSIISNTAVVGGAIENYGALTLVNSTISSNTATSYAGGIRHNVGSLSILNSTVAYNQSRGVYAEAGTTLALRNTIIAHTIGGINCDGGSSVSSQGHNLSDDNSCAAWFTATGDLNNVNPLLGPLQNNGGPTPTHALLPGSPAVNAGTNAGCPSTDQRGVSRPQGPSCDIGAVEMFYPSYLPIVLRQ